LGGVTDASDAAGWYVRTTGAGTWVAQLGLTQADVTAHEAFLTILESQITDGTVLARIASPEIVTGAWTFTNASHKIGGSAASPDIEITDLGTRDPQINAGGGSMYLKTLGTTTPTGDGLYVDDGSTNKAKVASVKDITSTVTAPTGDYPYGTLHLIY
jgi:hypothetical protein